MRGSLPVCTSPYHQGGQGGPAPVSRSNAFERRIEFRRLTDQGRETVVLDRIVCRSCMEGEVADRGRGVRPGAGTAAGPSLFEEAGP